MKHLLIKSLLITVSFTTATARAAEPAKPDARKINFQDDILPAFRDACLNCHNPDKKKAGLDLSTYQATMTGSDNGLVVKVGDPSASSLFKTITHAEEPFMPQKADKMADPKIAMVRTWIATGAPENSGSKVTMVEKKNDLSKVSVTIGKPSGPPPMPSVRLPLEPVAFTRNPGAVSALACSPWAPVAAISGQHQIVLYNTQTFDLIGILPFTAGQADVVRFSRNGTLLLAAGGQAAKSGSVIIWNVIDAKKVAEVGNEFDTVLSADISPDQSTVVLGTPNKVLKSYNISDGKVAWSVKKHTDWVTAASFSPDGVLVASGDRAGNVYVFEAKNGRDFYTLAGHKDAITSVSFRDDGNVLLTSSADGTFKLWNMHEGNNIKTTSAHANGVMSAGFAHDGRIVTCGRDNLVKVWNSDGDAGKAFEPFSDIVLQTAFTDDGQKVIAGDWTGAIRVLNIADNKKLGEFTANPAGPAQRLASAEKTNADAQVEFDNLTRETDAAKAGLDKANAELAAARAAKGGAEVETQLNKRNAANRNLQQTTEAVQTASNNFNSKKGELNNLNQQKIQVGIQLENAQKGGRKEARTRLDQILLQIKQGEESLVNLEKAIKPAQENKGKAENTAKLAQEELNKSIAAADPVGRQLPNKIESQRVANEVYVKATAARDISGTKLAAAKNSLEQIKASIAGKAPSTQPVKG